MLAQGISSGLLVVDRLLWSGLFGIEFFGLELSGAGIPMRGLYTPTRKTRRPRSCPSTLSDEKRSHTVTYATAWPGASEYTLLAPDLAKKAPSRNY